MTVDEVKINNLKRCVPLPSSSFKLGSNDPACEYWSVTTQHISWICCEWSQRPFRRSESLKSIRTPFSGLENTYRAWFYAKEAYMSVKTPKYWAGLYFYNAEIVCLKFCFSQRLLIRVVVCLCKILSPHLSVCLFPSSKRTYPFSFTWLLLITLEPRFF